MCSGSTTCCATTSPLTFMIAQEASCDSRTMVEKPVRNSEFCISCTMPDRLALMTSRSTAERDMVVLTCHCEHSEAIQRAMAAVPGLLRRFASRNDALAILRHNQILPLIDTRGLAGADHRGAVELIEHCRPVQRQTGVELFALVHRARYSLAVKAHVAGFDQCIRQRATLRLELRQGHRLHHTDAAHAIGDDLDRLFRRAVAELAFVLGVERLAQR